MEYSNNESSLIYMACVEATKPIHVYALFFSIMEEISSFCEATDTLFWTSDDVCPGLQRQGESLTCMFSHQCTIDYSDVTPVDLLIASIATKAF